MNFLAHAYLSFGRDNLLLGNLVADFIRGKQIDDLPEEVRVGVNLHRAIDAFTDSHAVNKEVKLIFRQIAGRYDSSFLDISYDYFLASDPTREPQDGWLSFSQSCYYVVDKHLDELPNTFQRLYAYMKKENWLYSYREKAFIQKSFERFTRRTKFLLDDTDVFSVFENEQKTLREAYDSFFPDLEDFVKSEIQISTI